MEHIGDIQSAVIQLSSQDALLSFANHPLVHFYANTNGDGANDFMPTNMLKMSMFIALKEFPILLGHIQSSTGGLHCVVVDKDNINMPEFVESFSETCFDDIKSARFNWNSWPAGVAITGAVTEPSFDGTIKLLSVHVVRLKSNSGVILFCNIPHYIVDGFGYYEFLRRWSQICKQLRSSKTQKNRLQSPPESSSYVFDRNTVLDRLDCERKQLDTLSKYVLTKKSLISSVLTKIPFSQRSWIISKSLRVSCDQAHWFWIKTSSLQELQTLVETSISGLSLKPENVASYALLASLVSTAVARAQKKLLENCGIVGKFSFMARTALSWLVAGHSANTHVLMNALHLHRHIQVTSSCYVGNLVMVHPVVSKIDHDQCSSAQRLFVESAFDLYKQLSGISREVVSEFVDTLEANPTAYARLAMFASSAPSAITFIDERDYGMDMVDFGDNGPVWISGIHQQMPNLIALFKQPPPMDNGVAMFACLRSEIVEQLISDPFFSRYAELF